MPCEEGLSLLPDACVDLFVTSPPYGGLRDYDGFEWDFYEVSKQIYRVLKPGGVLCWNTGDEIIKGVSMLYPERQCVHFADMGLILWDRITWEKHGVPSPTSKRYYNVTEPIYVFSKGEPKCLNLIEDRRNISAGRKEITHKRNSREHRERSNRPIYYTKEFGRRTNLWYYPNEQNSSGHPAVMNSRLAYDLVRTYSNEGDLVCDPFAGSGTTVFVCEKLNREWIAFEISLKYSSEIQSRLNKFKHNLFA